MDGETAAAAAGDDLPVSIAPLIEALLARAAGAAAAAEEAGFSAVEVTDVVDALRENMPITLLVISARFIEPAVVVGASEAAAVAVVAAFPLTTLAEPPRRKLIRELSSASPFLPPEEAEPDLSEDVDAVSCIVQHDEKYPIHSSSSFWLFAAQVIISSSPAELLAPATAVI